MRFNPPPNWPPAPPGWAPDSDWVPDPSWPPPPPGWQLWVDDGVGVVPPFPPGQLSQFQTQYPQYPPYAGQWPPPPPPGPGSRKLLWLVLVAAGVVVLLAAAFVVRVALLTHTSEKPSKKSDITQLTAEMLVGRSAFPEISGGKWISGVNSTEGVQSNMPNLTIDPPECADLYGDSKDASQTATATLANIQPGGLHSMRVHLAITPQQRNLREYLQSCRSFTQTVQSAGRTVTTEVRLDPLDAPGVPPWAVASVMTSSGSPAVRLPMSVTAATVSGYYRGVLVVASSNDIRLRPKSDAPVDGDTMNNLVSLFNSEVEKLEAAP